MNILNNLDRNTKIQRYMDFSKFLHILETKKIFMCRIDKFEDKLEGGLTFINDFLYSGGAEAISNLVNNSLPSSSGKGYNSPESMEQVRKSEQEYKEKLFPTVFGDIELSTELTYKEVVRKQKEWLDVSCWHCATGNTESIAMWKIYGNDANSICITTTIGELLDSIQKSGNKNLVVYRVKYIDHREEHYDLDVESGIAPFVHKHKAYQFENEIRFIAYDESHNLSNTRAEAGSSLKFKSTEFIDSVKVSPEAPQWFFDLVQSIFNERYGHTGKVVRSDLDDLVTTFSS